MRSLLLVACASLTMAGAASAQDRPTYADVGLRWEEMPSVKDMARYYPLRARVRGHARGVADLACTPDARGRLDCDVLQENPVDGRFGEAAQRVMRRATVASVDGGSPAGRTFYYTLRFGNWPAAELPDRYHPTEAGLRWVRRPELKGVWNMSGQAKNEVYAASFDCVVQVDGSPNCTPTAAESPPRFVHAAQESLEQAKVQRVDGRNAAGTRFAWTIQAVSQNHCKRSRRLKDSDVARVPVQLSAQQESGNASGAPGFPIFSGQSAPNCIPAMVQLQ